MNLRKHKRRLYQRMRYSFGTYVYILADQSSWYEQMGHRVQITPEEARNLCTGEIGQLHGFSFFTSSSK